ncbi:hypothetical protein [Conchiformibius steedae]|uniref:Lipoprotein n=1 Tax=Conchiformibius steedae TaxID=153493 RepID=A0A3P2ACB0_9NEIS|nr:hypothetical protein [Conchiformibius steedae]RRD91273.1 hypothetical protein EII21_02475 [Conchiformibius steedae]
MKPFNIFYALVGACLLLTACEKTPPPPAQPSEEYHFGNKKYQDFFSQYLRAAAKQDPRSIDYKYSDYVRSYTAEYIQKHLGITPKNPNLLFRLRVSRTDPNNKKAGMPSKYIDTQDVLLGIPTRTSHKRVPCNSEPPPLEGMFCFQEYSPQANRIVSLPTYVYLPHEKGMKKIPHINQSIDFDCSLPPHQNCSLFEYPGYPYNLKIFISFTKPSDFFEIIQIVEQYFYQTTGVHIWERPLKRNKNQFDITKGS